jgi:NitT/TauT family transport system substrate-binding protein
MREFVRRDGLSKALVPALFASLGESEAESRSEKASQRVVRRERKPCRTSSLPIRVGRRCEMVLSDTLPSLRSAIILVASLAMLLSPGEASTQNLPSADLNLGVYPGSLVTLTELVAQNVGIYKSHGLRVELVNLRSGPDQIAALANGSIDIAALSVDNVMLANFRGQDLRVIIERLPVAIYTWLAQNNWPTPNKQKPYPQNMVDLRGARLGVTARGAAVEHITRAIVRDAGLNPDRDLTYLAVGVGQQAIAAFKAKQIDVLVAFEPLQTVLIDGEKIAKPILDLRFGEGPAKFNVWTTLSAVARRAELEKNPEKYRRFQEAHIAALKYMQEPANFDHVVEIYLKHINLDKSLVESMLRKNIKSFGYIYNCIGHRNNGQFLAEAGLLKPENVPSCKDLVWGEGYKYAVNLDDK